jgi:hypothetical protein
MANSMVAARGAGAAACVLLALLVATPDVAVGRPEPLFVFPDAFSLAQEDGRPRVTVLDLGQEREVTLLFEASWDTSLDALKRQYGESYYDLDITRVGVVPLHADLASKFFSRDNPGLVDVQVDVDFNQLRLRFRFARDYSVAQLREAALLPVSLGTVDATVTCIGSMSMDRCGTALRRVPLMNSFAQHGNQEHLLAAKHYTYLHTYAANLVATEHPFLSEEFSQQVLQSHWHGGACHRASQEWHREACLIAARHARPVSLRAAVLHLAAEVFPEVPDDNLEYFVCAGSQLHVRRLNLAMNFERVRRAMNDGIRLHGGPGELDSPTSLIRDVAITTEHWFTLAPDVLFWDQQRLVLLPSTHMRGRSALEFSVFGSSYWIPVVYDVLIGFSYDPVTEIVTVTDFGVTNLEFLEREGTAFKFIARQRNRVEALVNAYLQSAKQRDDMAHRISRFLGELRTKGMGFTPLLNE